MTINLFDANIYRANHPDLAGFSDAQALQHYQTHKLEPENLLSNLNFYRASNSDLSPANLSNVQPSSYLENYGIAAGRSDSLANSQLVIGDGNGRFDLSDGVENINQSLLPGDAANPTRVGSYSDDYRLIGVEAGQTVEISMDAEFDAYLQIINAVTGDVIAFNDDIAPGNLNSQVSFTVLEGVNYLIRATSFSAQASGTYNLTGTASSIFAGAIAENQTLFGSLDLTDLKNPTRLYSFRDDYQLTEVTVGQQVRINLGSSTFDTYLQLVNRETSAVISFDDDSGAGFNSELSFTVQANTQYIVRVTSFSGGATGAYTLTTTSTIPTIGLDASLTGSLATTDLVNSFNPSTFKDDYRLMGLTAGQQIRINLNSLAFDTHLYLINDFTGQAILSDTANPSLNSELVFTAQAGTNYLIRVSSAAANAIGAYTLSTTLLSGPDWFSQNILDLELQAISRTLANDDGILSRNDMLAIFQNAEDGGIISETEVLGFRALASNSVRFQMPDYVAFLSNRVAQTASANLAANIFASDILGRWFLGTVAPTPIFNGISVTYTAVQGTLFGATGQARIGDIDQGYYLGNCAFLAALGATFGAQRDDNGNTSSSVINSMIIDNGDNTYTIRFYAGGTPEWVTVDRRLATLNGWLFGASANGSFDPNNPNNVLWAPLVERAYAQWREWREGVPGYNLIGNGDNLVRPLQFVTGRSATDYGTSTSNLFAIIQTALANGQAVETGRLGSNTPVIVGGHAYSVTNAYTASGQQRIVVRNPWGVDGLRVIGSNDGFIDLSFAEFVSSFNFGVAIA